MHRPGSKYFKGRLVCGERVFHYVIWDGVHNYENPPPLQALVLAEKMGPLVYVRVDEDAVEDIQELIDAPRSYPEMNGVVVWTRDHRTYRLIVHQLVKTGHRMM
jgi:hypothetical protein